MNIVGKIHAIFGEQQVSTSFKKREFVLICADNPMYPQFIKLEFTQEKCAHLDKFKVGDTVDVSFNLKGREWKNPKGELVYFNTLDAWRIVSASSSNAEASPQNLETTNYQQPPGFTSPATTDAIDDLPF
ncbi:MAG: DUF3127 domain-containing protein [Bacteroidia bacterium]|nr:DUF3127 domain-containing protein [Bacteroidia bacterium]